MCKVCSLLVVVSLFLVKSAFACNGYNMILSDITKCDGAAGLVRLSDDFNMKLTKSCRVVPSGCIYFKDLDSGLMEVEIKLNGTALSDEVVNLCSYEPLVTCPIDSGKLCLTRDFTRDITRFKDLLGSMVGRYDVKYTFYHKEKTSCVKFTTQLGLESS